MPVIEVTTRQPYLFFLKETAEYPNSRLPAVLYRQAVFLPDVFRSQQIKAILAQNDWANAWDSGIYTYHHYHSTSHEVLAFYKGNTIVQLGGPAGERIMLSAGDVLIIPAGVAHKNLGLENQVKCIGAYPGGRKFDINTGKPGERPDTDRTIAALPFPEKDPIYGGGRGIPFLWSSVK